MRIVAAVIVATVVAALGACNEPKVANRCAGEVEPHCLTSVVCAYDQKRGCEVCTCDTPFPPPTPSGEPTMPPVR